MHLVLYLAVISAASLLVVTVAAYNGLASLRQDVRDAWGAMDQQLRRRYDLLPALVSAVRATTDTYPPALSATLTARNQAAVAFNPQQLAVAEGAITAHLRQLFDQPPADLAANPAFVRSRADLLAVAIAIDLARRKHDDAVHAYNVALVSFPHDVIASVFGFTPQPTFDADAQPAGTP